MILLPVADVTFTTEGISVITVLLLTMGGVIALLYRTLRASDEDRIKHTIAVYEERLREVRVDRDIYKQMAEEAIDSLEEAVKQRFKEQGIPPPRPLAPVVPEHSSPATHKQEDTAEMQTIRARLVAAKLTLGLPARKSSVPEDDKKK